MSSDIQPHILRFKWSFPTLNGESGDRNKEVCYMYAIIKTGGKQLMVEEGQEIYVEKLDVEPGETVVFNEVVAIKNRTLRVGTPLVSGATVTAKVEKHGKGDKITIFKYVAKKSSTRRKQGHRQPYTKLIVETIEGY